MSTSEKRNKLMIMLDGDVSVEIADTYLELAEKAVINLVYPFGKGDETMPEKYEEVQIEIAAYFINKMGAEGETEHIEGGTHRHYESADIPNSIKSRITPKVGGFGE